MPQPAGFPYIPTSQVELHYNPDDVFSDSEGARQTGIPGFVRCSAVDFLDEYFDENGNPNFYPNMDDPRAQERRAVDGSQTEHMFLDMYGSANWALRKRRTGA